MIVFSPSDPGSSLYEIQIQGVGKAFQLFFTTVEEKHKWMMNLTDAIAAEMIRQSTIKRVGDKQTDLQISPVWQPDSDHLDCSVCRVQFTLFFRRHHCRQCGNVVCATCSSNRMVINYYNKKQMERVCDICFQKSGKNQESPNKSALSFW